MSIEQQLLAFLPASRIRARYIDVVSYASDAGFYYLLPKAVVLPNTEAEIVSLFKWSHAQKVPIVFRAGGTSLSGQSITDGVLVDLSQYWNKLSIENNGDHVRVLPGVTGAMVNAYLRKYQRKIGPDPSSISAAMMGGILSNNSSGMCCGVAQNSYHTTRYIRFILPDGNTFSTERLGDYERLQTDCPVLFETITRLRNQILSNEALHQKIRRKYLTKNTVGYSLNAFIDHQHPLDILAHLLIGAEGTLAFIAEAVMDTVPDYPYKSTALLYFTDIYAACQAIVPLTQAGALMVELMDRASLRSVENMAGMPAIVKTLPEAAAALLIEFQESVEDLLRQRVEGFMVAANNLALLEAPVFTYLAAEQAFYWKVRKGLFPAVGAVRASGTSVILEDIAVPVEKIGDAITDLQQLFAKYHYHNAIIFGHAKDGNIHFVVTQTFNIQSEVDRYEHFMDEVIAMVVHKYNGALKAEHGTGRNMAPFVETEWGGDAYEIMKQVKQAIDPDNLLNPGVIINHDAKAHIKNLKAMPAVEEEVDKCIECGYCEHRCPSRDLTTTPRRRIVVRRALKTLQQQGDKEHYNLLTQQYQYDGLDTCAVDGLCATACPVDINTGDLVKRLRRESHNATANATALRVAKNFSLVERLARTAVQTGTGINGLLGKNFFTGLTTSIKKVIPAMPLWSRQITAPPKLNVLKKATSPDRPATIVYFPACITRMLGTYEGRQKNLMETFMSICTKAAIGVKVLDKLTGSCCSQIFSSKGFKDAQAYTANDIVDRLWTSTYEGKLPVVIDVSSCAYTLHHLRPVLTALNQQRFDALTILDSVEFIYSQVLPLVQVQPLNKQVVLHPVCSLEKMKTSQQFEAIARRFATNVTIPENAGCCGMAGDRGFLFPELTASATHHEATEVTQQSYDGYYSSTKTCEMAMTQAVGKNYESILYLVDEGMQ